MQISNVIPKGLRHFIERDDLYGLPAEHVDKIRNIVSYLLAIEDPEELRAIPGWRAHRLSGDRRGSWTLVVTRNWRITFRVDQAEGEIVGLDYED